MVELTKYAMDAMGLESDSRVTFSQITKYREKLNTEFNTAVKEGLEKLGVSDPSSVTFTLAEDGSLTATSANASNRWSKTPRRDGKSLMCTPKRAIRERYLRSKAMMASQ